MTDRTTFRGGGREGGMRNKVSLQLWKKGKLPESFLHSAAFFSSSPNLKPLLAALITRSLLNFLQSCTVPTGVVHVNCNHWSDTG